MLKLILRRIVLATRGGGVRPYLFIIFAVIVLIAVPLGMASSAVWFQSVIAPKRSAELPDWVTLGVVQATTTDGTSVKARVALDAGTPAARSAIESQMEQLELLLQTTVGHYARNDLTGPAGMTSLSGEMRQQLNAYLKADDAELVRSVAIVELVYSQP